MNKRQFVRQRRGDWKRFEILVDRMERARFSRMPADETTEFSRLFRRLSNDLAMVRSRDWGHDLDEYLNHLVARGHNSFYSAPPAKLSRFAAYLTAGFPRLFRANVRYFVVSACLFFVPGAISWAVIQTNPELASRILPIEALAQFDTMYGKSDADAANDEDDAAAGSGEAHRAKNAKDASKTDADPSEDWDTGFSEGRAAMYGFYIRNNVGIALECFARGVLLGIGTVYTLLYNGIVIGAIGGYVVSRGNAGRFLSFVVSHGSFELTAIAVSGGAGLMLGNAILHPGDRSRVEALRVRGLDAVQIACGAAAMLVVAAVIEAFWSPSGVPAIYKYVVGGVLWLLVFLYLGFAGRGK